LLPTSVLIRRNHRIRIAIAGHDKDTFARIPASGVPAITVSRNKRHASLIELPVIPRSQAQTSAPTEPLNKAKGEAAAAVKPAEPPKTGSAEPGVKLAGLMLRTVEQVMDRYVEARGGRDAILKITSRVMKGTFS
ncbi:MAG: hypothetical protein M3362_10325, partial [Acidobacteriota bacterium]|nr:hypothetical protein [Acidobacteriota bacterium]